MFEDHYCLGVDGWRLAGGNNCAVSRNGNSLLGAPSEKMRRGKSYFYSRQNYKIILLRLQSVKLLRRIGVEGICENKISGRVELVCRDALPVHQRQRKVGGRQHIKSAVGFAAETAQNNSAAARADVAKTGRRRRRDDEVDQALIGSVDCIIVTGGNRADG